MLTLRVCPYLGSGSVMRRPLLHERRWPGGQARRVCGNQNRAQLLQKDLSVHFLPRPTRSFHRRKTLHQYFRDT